MTELATDARVDCPLPRYRWLKRFAAGYGALVAMVGMGWGAWAWYAQHTLNQEIARLHGKGEPVFAADIHYPPRDNDRDALPLLRQAASAISTTADCPASSSMTYGDELPYPKRWHKMMDKAFAANANVYPLLRKAREMGLPSSRAELRVPLTANTGGLAPLRALSNLSSDTALYYHFRGNDQAALEAIADTYFIGDQAASQSFLVAELVGIGIRAQVAHRLATIAAELNIEGTIAASTQPGTPAKRQQIQNLVRYLAQEEARTAEWKAILREERASVMDAPRGSGETWLLDPMRTLDRATYLQASGKFMATLDLPPLVKLEPGGIVTWGFSGSRIIHPTSDILQLSGPLMRLVCVERSNMARSLIALATALYRADHGTYPPDLAALVPAYLPAVPRDPFAADGSCIRYRLAAGGKRPILISAGLDGIAQTTDDSFIPSAPSYSWQNMQSTKNHKSDDQYCDLSAWKDPSPSEPDTEDNDPDQAGQPNQPNTQQ